MYFVYFASPFFYRPGNSHFKNRTSNFLSSTLFTCTAPHKYLQTRIFSNVSWEISTYKTIHVKINVKRIKDGTLTLSNSYFRLFLIFQAISVRYHCNLRRFFCYKKKTVITVNRVLILIAKENCWSHHVIFTKRVNEKCCCLLNVAQLENKIKRIRCRSRHFFFPFWFFFTKLE